MREGLEIFAMLYEQNDDGVGRLRQPSPLGRDGNGDSAEDRRFSALAVPGDGVGQRGIGAFARDRDAGKAAGLRQGRIDPRQRRMTPLPRRSDERRSCRGPES